MSTLLLRETDVEHLLDMRTTIDVMEEAFRQLAEGHADNVPRRRSQAGGIVLHSMSAAADYLGLVGWKQYTTTRLGAKFYVGLHDQESGELIALIDADRLGQMRTGAVTGLAARLLANTDTEEVGLFGSGWQAQSQLAAVATACPIRRARVYSRNEQRRVDFATKMSEQLDIEVVPVDDPRQAVEGLPVVVTATTSRQPVFDGQWLSKGALICAIGSNWLEKAEVDVATVRRAARVVCDGIEACQLEAGDFVPALEAGVFRWSEALELADVAVGRVAARENNLQIILFKSVGMAIEDVAIGAKIVELAKKQGIGRPLFV
jgi:ornithine cyclodeaminase/alanine dehydrogenase-like protein (mu-crystallin family)